MQIIRFLVGALIVLPLAVSAAPIQAPVQDDAALRASIQAAVLSDPRTDSLPPEQLNALVTALAADAVAHNIKPNDISYIPRTPSADFGSATTSETPGCDIWCSFADAYGLNDIDPTTPVLLIVTSGLLVMITRRMMRPQHLAYFTGTDTPKPPQA